MSTLGPRPQDPSSRLVKRILILLAVGAILIGALASHVGATYYRQYRHKTLFLEAVQEVDTESLEEDRLEDDARRRLLAGDFVGLDALVREARASQAAFPDGTWRLTTLYFGLTWPEETWTESEWQRRLEQAQRWSREYPDSIAARLATVDLWISYAWAARGDGWSNDVPPEQWAIYKQRLSRAAQLMREMQGVDERCPRRAATILRLALVGEVSKADEAKTFAEAIAAYPDYQPLYVGHLRFLQQRWHGEPGEFEAAGLAIARRPDGPERYARAIWSLQKMDSWDPPLVSWPLMKQGFAAMRAKHPDSLKIPSASCLFAGYYHDRDEAKRMLAVLGHRMDTSVWRDRDQFAQTYNWATFEDGELAGGDPVARFFAWLMGA